MTRVRFPSLASYRAGVRAACTNSSGFHVPADSEARWRNRPRDSDHRLPKRNRATDSSTIRSAVRSASLIPVSDPHRVYRHPARFPYPRTCRRGPRADRALGERRRLRGRAASAVTVTVAELPPLELGTLQVTAQALRRDARVTLLPATRRFLVTCKPASAGGIRSARQGCRTLRASRSSGAPAARSGTATRHGGRRFPSRRLPQHFERRRQVQRFPVPIGVAVWGPMLTPAAARRASVGASGAPSQHAAGGSAGNGTPSGRRNRNCPAASATT